MSKRTAMMFSLLLFFLISVAQEKSDTMYVFRFQPQKESLIDSYWGNNLELERLYACVEQNKEAILEGTIPLYVDGYCSSFKSEKSNLATAKIRSNRVKSELIIRKGLTEECFVTCNHATDGDFVTVRLVVPKTPSEAELAARRKIEQDSLAAERHKEEQKRLAAERIEQERLAAKQQKAEQERLAIEQTESQKIQPQESFTDESVELKSESTTVGDYNFALRANLLRWVTLTPDIGVEWRIDPSWGVLINGSWTSWTWNDKGRRYALWEVAPEIRYYLGNPKAWYVGAMFKAGQFNYKLCDTGRQGDLMGGGITGGYQLRLNKSLSLDFSIAIGCLHTAIEKYEVIDGVRVRRGSVSKNWWGPINAGVSLVWKLF